MLIRIPSWVDVMSLQNAIIIVVYFSYECAHIDVVCRVNFCATPFYMNKYL